MPCAQAFGRADRAAVQSQAATLLLLRAQVRRGGAALAARAKRARRPARVQLAPAPGVVPLRVPRIRGTRRRVPEEAVVAALTRRYGPVVAPRRARTARAKRRGTAVAPGHGPCRRSRRQGVWATWLAAWRGTRARSTWPS